MRFRHFILLEQDPGMGGGPPGAPPMDPMAGGMGGPPGGDPMGGGMGGPPPGGAAPTPPEPQPIPQHADVWDVLDSILGHQPIEQEKQLKKYKSQKAELSAQNPPPGGPPGGGPPPGMGSGGPPSDGALLS